MDFQEQMKMKIQNDKEKEQRYKNKSKERLKNFLEKKIKTTMIGALHTMENNIGFLWGHNKEEMPTAEEDHMYQIYQNMRKEILDRGNNQIKQMKEELDERYDVEFIKYFTEFKPVTFYDKN